MTSRLDVNYDDSRRVKKAILDQYDKDLPVCIGEIQIYGSNFATELDNVDIFEVDDWEYGEENKVVLTQGSQIGIVCYGNDKEI